MKNTTADGDAVCIFVGVFYYIQTILDSNKILHNMNMITKYDIIVLKIAQKQNFPIQ